MAKFKIGDIAVCIRDCDGKDVDNPTNIHPNPPKKGEEFLVTNVINNWIRLGGISDFDSKIENYWDPINFKHKTNDLFESQIDVIEESLVEELKEILHENE